MKATLVQRERAPLDDDSFVEIIIWAVSEPVPPATHGFKYRLAYVTNETCVVRYDNERGKGDHKHVGDKEVPYTFTTLDKLTADFWADVARRRR
ncbi:MAG: DUF6516 family protein [Rudaea sp.]|uniref:toxin-antitoxin system TumE family protein n=1 Tax=Rudaea sp. TaxID=2136325 RepID=UPI0039E28B36